MTANEITYALSLIGKALNLPATRLARDIFGVRPETLGNWRRGNVKPSRSTEAILKLMVQAIEGNKNKQLAAIVAALQGQ